MVTAGPSSVNKQTLDATIVKMNELSKSFTKKDCAPDFSKTWKYAEVFNWFQDLMEVLQSGHEAIDSNASVQKKEEEMETLKDEITTAEECLEDLKVYGMDSIQQEIDVLNTHIKACTEKQEERER